MKTTFHQITGNVHEKKAAMEANFRLLQEGKVTEEAALKYATELLKMPRRYGDQELLLWALDHPDNMPGEAVYDYVWDASRLAVITLICAGLMFPSVYALPKCTHILSEGMTSCIGQADDRGVCFLGHGYNAVPDFLRCMERFADGCLPLYFDQYGPNASPKFAAAFQRAERFLREDLISGDVRDAWSGESYAAEAREVVEKLDARNIFVYGTLMSGQRASGYLDGCALLGRYCLRDYAMYNLGAYPGIVPQEGETVVGEVYCVPADRLPELDAYEGEGSLYHRRAVTVEREGSRVPAQAYVYARRREGTLMREPWDSKGSDRVWYAGYGSNLSAERFACYIKGGVCKENGNPYVGCTDKTLWSESCLRDYPGRMYFGQKSGSWEGKGVAFYDPAQPGVTHMRLYQISRAQLHEVQAQEGLSPNWYGRLVTLGVHEDGCPIYTFTSEVRHEHNAPSETYLDLIRDALTKECGKTESEADAYLDKCRAN